MPSQYKGSKVGFPIRRSLDQSSFAAPQGISQRTTSFIASQRQGIHQMLLRHLITLMIDVRSAEPDTIIKERPVFGFLQRHVFACQAYPRSEEHTSELQSRQYLVCRILLEKKNMMTQTCI